MHRIEQMGRGAAGAQARQFRFQHAARALHAALDLVNVMRCICHGNPRTPQRLSGGANARAGLADDSCAPLAA